MMKKIYIGLFVLFILFLVGCENNKVPVEEISFDETYNTFVENVLDSEFDFESLMASGYAQEKINISGESDKKQSNLDIFVHAISNIDILKEYYDSELKFRIDISDDNIESNIKLTGDLNLKKMDTETFFKINNFDVNMGKGNAQGNLIKLIVSSFEKNWIMMDNSLINNSISQNSYKLYKLPKTLKKLTKQNKIFTNRGKTTYEGQTAFKIGIHKENMNKIIKNFQEKNILQEGLKIEEDLQFTGLLVAESEDNVYLFIKDWLVENEDLKANINGTIKKYDIKINMQDDISNQEIKFDISKRRNDYIVYINFKGLDDIVDIDMNMKNIESTEKTFYADFEGDVNYSSVSDPESDMVFDIEGFYQYQKIEEISIEKPENYLLLSDILGDDYATSAFTQTLNSQGLQDNPMNIQ